MDRLEKTARAIFLEKMQTYHCVRILPRKGGLIQYDPDGRKILSFTDPKMSQQLAGTHYETQVGEYSFVKTGSFCGSHVFTAVDYKIRWMDFWFRRRDLAVLFKLSHGGSQGMLQD